VALCQTDLREAARSLLGESSATLTLADYGRVPVIHPGIGKHYATSHGQLPLEHNASRPLGTPDLGHPPRRVFSQQ
jgi:hypothetical protein